MSDASYVSSGIREMSRNDLMGGTLRYLNATIACAVGTFEKREVLVGGGFSPMLLGDVEAVLTDFPAAAKFKAGEAVTVTPNTGSARDCKIYQANFSGPMVQLILHDPNEGA